MLSAASEEGSQIGKREPWSPFIYFFFLFKYASLKTWYRLSSFPPDTPRKDDRDDSATRKEMTPGNFSNRRHFWDFHQ